MTAEPIPPWLQPDPFWRAVIDRIQAPALAVELPTARIRKYVDHEEIAAARRVCARLDGLAVEGGLGSDVAQPDTLTVRGFPALCSAFDLLATPRLPRTVVDDPDRTVPAVGAVLMVKDWLNRSWRICWQHNDVRYRMLAAVPDHDPDMVRSAADLVEMWCPLTVLPAPGHRMFTPEGPAADAPASELPAGVCPVWCDLPAGHADWIPVEAGLTRTHRGARQLVLGEREASLVVTIAERAEPHGIVWGEPEIQLEQVSTASPDEAQFVAALLPLIGATLHDVALPLPPRLQIVGGTRIVNIPASLCTPAGRARAHRAVAS